MKLYFCSGCGNIPKVSTLEWNGGPDWSMIRELIVSCDCEAEQWNARQWNARQAKIMAEKIKAAASVEEAYEIMENIEDQLRFILI